MFVLNMAQIIVTLSAPGAESKCEKVLLNFILFQARYFLHLRNQLQSLVFWDYAYWSTVLRFERRRGVQF